MYAKDLHVVVKRLRNLFGFTIRQISVLLNISKTTIHRWLVYPDDGKRKWKQPKKINVDLAKIIATKPSLTLKDIKIDHDLDVSISTLSRRLSKLGITKKKVYQIGIPNMETTIELRKEFTKRIQDVSVDDVISLDETSFYTQMNPRYGWSLKGKRLTCSIQRKQSKRYTVTSAISNKGIVHQTVILGSSNEQYFLKFLEGLKDAPHKHIMLDNVAFHKTRKVRDMLKNIGKIPLFIAPYSPEWNPVEFYFSIMKSHLRKGGYLKDESKLEQFCKTCCTNSDIFHNIFQHSFKNILSNFHR